MAKAGSGRDRAPNDIDIEEAGTEIPYERPKPGTLARLQCCPTLDLDKSCSRLDFRYRLVQRANVTLKNRAQQVVDVEVILHAKLERCPGPLVLGDLVYSTTLLPGEKVRLFTQDRRNRFTFDSETNVSYRHEQTAEENYYMATMNRFMSDLTVSESGQAAGSSLSSYAVETDTPGLLGTLFGGADVEVGGFHTASSTRAFLNELRSHAESSTHRSVEATRTASSVSVGEVSTHRHVESESEMHYEASSRTFSNPNRCHAVTYLFYRLNKTQTLRFKIEAIERRVVDWSAPSKVATNPTLIGRRLAVIPGAVLATSQERLDVESMDRQSVRLQLQDNPALEASQFGPGRQQALMFAAPTREPLSKEVHLKALELVDTELVGAKLLNKVGGSISEDASKSYSIELRSSLPTPGLIVKACLDECTACEPTLRREIAIDLQRKVLDNRMLMRQIDLLDKAQEYRCCPEGSPDEEENNDEREGLGSVNLAD